MCKRIALDWQGYRGSRGSGEAGRSLLGRAVNVTGGSEGWAERGGERGGSAVGHLAREGRRWRQSRSRGKKIGGLAVQPRSGAAALGGAAAFRRGQLDSRERRTTDDSCATGVRRAPHSLTRHECSMCHRVGDLLGHVARLVGVLIKPQRVVAHHQRHQRDLMKGTTGSRSGGGGGG